MESQVITQFMGIFFDTLKYWTLFINYHEPQPSIVEKSDDLIWSGGNGSKRKVVFDFTLLVFLDSDLHIRSTEAEVWKKWRVQDFAGCRYALCWWKIHPLLGCASFSVCFLLWSQHHCFHSKDDSCWETQPYCLHWYIIYTCSCCYFLFFLSHHFFLSGYALQKVANIGNTVSSFT